MEKRLVKIGDAAAMIGAAVSAAINLKTEGGQLDRDSLWRGRLWPWCCHHGETSLCEAGRFVYILLIGVDISERNFLSVLPVHGCMGQGRLHVLDQEMKEYEFQAGEQVVVYADGSSRDNGKPNARGVNRYLACVVGPYFLLP